ncbi:MAG: D-glycero-alpha-D-manno-heptose-1,7-bisphosphate 7-phosphatase [Verrucomicrobiota bacterium]
MPAKALFLDRDGTIIVDRHYLADPAQVELLPGAREALHGFLADGWKLFLFTNQSGVGQGMFPLAAVHRCNARMLELLALPSPGFTETCIAPEAPDAPAVYRKPSPRFIREMIAKHSLDPAGCWMAGDKPSDVLAGLNAGIRSALLDSDHPPGPVPPEVWRCHDLAALRTRLLSANPP